MFALLYMVCICYIAKYILHLKHIYMLLWNLDTLLLAGAAPESIETVTSLLQHIGSCWSSRGWCRCRCRWGRWHDRIRLVGNSIAAHSAARLCWGQSFPITGSGGCGTCGRTVAAGLPGCVWVSGCQVSGWQWMGGNSCGNMVLLCLSQGTTITIRYVEICEFSFERFWLCNNRLNTERGESFALYLRLFRLALALVLVLRLFEVCLEMIWFGLVFCWIQMMVVRVAIHTYTYTDTYI